MELKENTLYTNKQIAQWFGLKKGSFSNKEQKQKKLQELKNFADYELVGNKTKKILIKRVYQSVYSKKGSVRYQTLDKNFLDYWSDGGKGLDTASRVAQSMYKDKITDLSLSTIESYTGKIKRDGWGINYVSRGKKGYAIYAWGKRVQDGDQVKLVPLTEQQQEIKRKLIKKYFGDTTEQHIFVQGMVEAGEITKEQAWGVLEELTNMKDKFNAFRAEFQVAINSSIGRGTYLITDSVNQESAFQQEV